MYSLNFTKLEHIFVQCISLFFQKLKINSTLYKYTAGAANEIIDIQFLHN